VLALRELLVKEVSNPYHFSFVQTGSSTGVTRLQSSYRTSSRRRLFLRRRANGRIRQGAEAKPARLSLDTHGKSFHSIRTDVDVDVQLIKFDGDSNLDKHLCGAQPLYLFSLK